MAIYLNSEVSEEVATQIAKNCSRRQPHALASREVIRNRAENLTFLGHQFFRGE